MATIYLPSEAGWIDNGVLGEAVQARLKIDRSYDAAANRSTLTITLQARAPQYGGRYELLDNALLTLGGQTVFSGGGSGSTALNAWVDFATDNAWHSLIDGASGQIKSWTATLSHAADGSATAVVGLTARLYRYNAYYFTFYDRSASAAMNETRQFSLSISAGTGSTVTVKRNGVSLADGATLTYGDVLTISFAAESGYELTSHTVNGASFTSGGTHTVTGAVTAAASAARKTYALTISAGTGSTVTVRRNGTALANGATLTHGDVLTISFAAQSGCELTSHTVNGANFTSGGTHTVTGAVTAAAAARRLGLLRLDTGSGIRRYRLLLDTGSAYVPVKIFLDRGDRITEAGI